MLRRSVEVHTSEPLPYRYPGSIAMLICGFPLRFSCVLDSSSRDESYAWQVLSVGCPAKGSAATGVKIRT